MAPIDPGAPPILFAVSLPASWAYRATQVGGGGSNGSIPSVTGGGHLARGWAVYGSDSGHQNPDVNWTMSDESLKNFGHAQLKKTHDAAWVIIERLYGRKPIYSYFIGNSQGGREALTVVQRWPNDYDGVSATVPVVNLSNINLSHALKRIFEIPLANYLPPAKASAAEAEVVRRCDGLDGLVDGFVNNYMACRELFAVKDGQPSPWIAKRCPANVDPNPADTSVNACLTDGQMASLEFKTNPYYFSEPLPHNNVRFGMWVPSIDMQDNELIAPVRYRAQEGAAPDAQSYGESRAWSGSLVLAGSLFKSLYAELLSYVEGGPLKERRALLSEWMDSMNPDLTPFYAKGGRFLAQVGTADSRASSGAQLDYYEAVVQKMGTHALNQIGRLYVTPQGGHGLSASSYAIDGNGHAIPSKTMPSTLDRVQMLIDWTEKNIAPSMEPVMASGDGRTMRLCSYPTYPRYRGVGSPDDANSYTCEK